MQCPAFGTSRESTHGAFANADLNSATCSSSVIHSLSNSPCRVCTGTCTSAATEGMRSTQPPVMSSSSAFGTGASAAWPASGIAAARVQSGPYITKSLTGPGSSTNSRSGSAAQAEPLSRGTRTRQPDTAMPSSGQPGCLAAMAVVTAPPIECPMTTTPGAPAP